ncbi:MAG: hypothetical protein Q4A84_01240 [Neisseria sp.]|uniref:hypothetical protein n=1 Tax=Neisseria sp. TaxID=192066 RepID=UPI0026DBE226|nr:hypothetical protein [Neisseria sp.]MDO4640318.1 hypothetical protein [Neisseria sp.]
MKPSAASLLTIAIALSLSACAAKKQPETAETEAAPAAHAQKQTEHTKQASGTACRSIGEGRKFNNKGQNDGFMCSAAAALNSAEAKEVLDPSIKVSYGSVGSQTLVSRQIANAVHKTPDETCQRAFLSAVKRFQGTAAKKKARSVRMVSYFDKQTKGGSEYECHIGTWNSRVVLKGSLN